MTEIKPSIRTQAADALRRAGIQPLVDGVLEAVANELRADAWEEGKLAGLRQSDWEHGDTAVRYVATNPYRAE